MTWSMPRDRQSSAQVEAALDDRGELHAFTPRAFSLHRAPFSSLEKGVRPMKVCLRLGLVALHGLLLESEVRKRPASRSNLAAKERGRSSTMAQTTFVAPT